PMIQPALAFLAVSIVFFGIGMLMIRGGGKSRGDVLVGGEVRPVIFGVLTPALAMLLPLGVKTRKHLSQELCQAGYYHRNATEEYLSLRNVLVIGWLILIGTLLVIVSRPGEGLDLRLLMVGVLGMIILYSLPRLYLSSRAKARVRRMEYALPDALDMISMCMTGGLGFQQALTRVGSELAGIHPDLACELRIVSRQADSISLSMALKRFAERINTTEIQSLASVVGQTERHGNAVASVFHEFASEVRRQRRQSAEEKGNRTSVQMLLPLIFCLAPPIYVLLLTPAVIELRGFVMQENVPGGILSPMEATQTLQSPVRSPAEPEALGTAARRGRVL
ncbi:MAG: type II secretion system F family protein, partial [Thermoguttaceae bacterium]